MEQLEQQIGAIIHNETPVKDFYIYIMLCLQIQG